MSPSTTSNTRPEAQSPSTACEAGVPRPLSPAELAAVTGGPTVINDE